MDVSKWICGDRQGTLNPVPDRRHDPSDTKMRDLEQKLQDAQIDASTLGRLNWPLVEMIYTLEVDGNHAEQLWRQLRAISIDTGYWPVIVADEEELDGLVENISCHLDYDNDLKTWVPRKKSYFSENESFDDPDPNLVIVQQLKKLEGSAEPIDVAGNGTLEPSLDDLIVKGEKLDLEAWMELRCVSNEDLDVEFVGADWPRDISPDNSLQSLQMWDPDLGSRELDTVFVLLVRAEHSWEVPAKLLFGGWNECPVPQVHVGFLKRWFKNFDAELLSVGRATIEVRIGKPPQDREEALDLAREQFIYCPDSVDLGDDGVTNFAAELLNGRIWHFWWE